MNPLLTATQLVDWADDRRAQDVLPLLVRRLILASVNPLRIDFASGDSINRPGYDGVLQTVDGAPLVPAGQSVWEMGTAQNPSSKASTDYTTRKADPGEIVPAETTFVFVTPRRWQGKEEWAAEKRAEDFWLDVRAVDAVDLEQWLDRCHAVGAWARRQIVGTPEGLRDLDDVWESWATRTNPPLTSAVFTAGRTEAMDRVRRWLAGPPACLRVRAESADEAVGFIAAVVQALDSHTRELVLAHAVLVSNPDVWRAVAGGRTPTILVAASTGLGAEAQAVARGHHVAIAYGNDSAGVAVDVRLPPLRRNDLENALRGMGIADDRSRDLAAESHGRLTAVVDLLGGGTGRPHWAAPAVAPQLVPFLLAGSWSQSPGDFDAVHRLARVPPDELSQRLSRWANETDPPIRLVGGMWEWISRQRAWPHLGRYLTASDLTALQRVAADVLGEVDPRLGLAPDELWMAVIHNCSPRYSEALRKGLAEVLAILATHPDGVRAGCDPVGLVNGVVRELFGPEPSPARWYSLAPVLPLLAEAAPDVFLTMVERDPVGDAAVRTALFQEEGHFGGSRHCHLLWALETVAWSSEYLARVAVALGGLAANDPGGRTANRPAASLRTIFLAWKPSTTASVVQRLAAIDALSRRYPDVAFDLCLQLVPTRHETASPTPRPRCRPWAADHQDKVTFAEYREYVAGLFDRALTGAAHVQARWTELLNPIRDVPAEQFEALFRRLEALPLEQFAEQSDDRLRRAVRRLLHEKRTIDGIYPELTDTYVTRLEGVYTRLAPSDRIRREAWLFDTHPELLSVTGIDWRVEEEARRRERQAVVRGVIEQGGDGDLVRLADSVQDPWSAGYFVGQSDLAEADVTDLLTACLEAEGERRRRFARGMVWGRFRRDGWPWVERLFAADELRAWPAARTAAFAFALPFETTTWDWVEGWGEAVAAEYWRTMVAWVTDARRDAPRAVRTLLARGRPFAAFHITRMDLSGGGHEGAVPAELLLEVLRAMTAAATGVVETAEGQPQDRVSGYDLGQLLNVVERTGVADEQELARLEWAWLPALEHTPRGPATLHRALARDPAFFAMLVGLIYRPRFPGREDEPVPEPTERARAVASQAWHLLHDWHGVPGRDDDGVIDPDALRRWVDGARDAFRSSGHITVGDQQVGEVLARAPAGSDGVWPQECVRTILEDLQSDDIESGVYLGVVNGRGVTCRSPDDGGDQERELAERYARWAESTFAFLRTARLLRSLADHYLCDARREDDRRDINEYWR